MGEVLNNGVYLPDRGERNAYDGLKGNWNTLDSIAGKVPGYDGHISDTDIHVTAADKQTWNGKADASHVHNANDVTTGVFDAARIPNLDASKITTGTIDIDRLPQGALERLVKVADQAARYALTAADVQLGDTVQQLDTGVMYVVTDETKLDSADGYTEYTAGSATSVPWSGVTEKPADYTPASHSHGNITNDGKVGTTANKPLITGTGGAVQAGSFGNAANTFCEGNDSRLSDARTPVAHTHSKSDVTDLLNSNFIPSANNSYDLGSSSYQWNNLYAKNYYYNGVAWGLDKANVWTEENTFQAQSIYQVNSDPRHVYKSSSLEIGVQPTGSHTAASYWLDKNSNELGFTRFVEYNNSVQTYEIGLSNKATNGALDPTGNDIATYIRFELNPNGVSKLNLNVNALRPVSDGLSDLGDSTHQWKTLNGINPGGLSFPDYNNVLDVTSEIPIASLDGNTQINLNDYLADKTGWLSIVIDDTAGNSIIVIQGKPGGSTAFNNSRTFHTGAQSNGYISVFFPIIAGTSKIAFIKASSLIQMRFYYCLGNV